MFTSASVTLLAAVLRSADVTTQLPITMSRHNVTSPRHVTTSRHHVTSPRTWRHHVTSQLHFTASHHHVTVALAADTWDSSITSSRTESMTRRSRIFKSGDIIQEIRPCIPVRLFLVWGHSVFIDIWPYTTVRVKICIHKIKLLCSIHLVIQSSDVFPDIQRWSQSRMLF